MVKTRSDIIKELSLRYGIKEPIIKAIIYSPFEFAAQKIRESDKKDLRFYYLGKFRMKNKFLNEEESTNTVIPQKDMAD